jgi:hypothetical protein
MPLPELSQAYVIALCAELERRVPALRAELEASRARAARVDAELTALVGRLAAAKQKLEDLRRRQAQLAQTMSEKNSRVAQAHQESGALTKKASDIKTEMDRVGPGQIQIRLRRERAKLLVQIEDREKEVTKLRAEVDSARHGLTDAETETSSERDRQRQVFGELDGLQAQLPRPQLYTELTLGMMAGAHCRLFLDQAMPPWTADLGRALDLVSELHKELRKGSYRLDKNSELLGGRDTATVEATYAAVAIGEQARARELFALGTDPSLFFDQIFNTFRLYCLGFYLESRTNELRSLLQRHEFSTGLRGGYVQAFAGLLAKDQAKVGAALRVIVKHEWEVWQDPKLVRGAGVVNVGATAIARLALDRGLRVVLPGPTVPELVVLGDRRKHVAP